VSLDKDGRPTKVPPLIMESPDDQERCRAAQERRAERLRRKNQDRTTSGP
jgi:acyl-CoA hydrolase